MWTSDSEQKLSMQSSCQARDSRMPGEFGHRRPVGFRTAEHSRRAAGFLAPHPSMTPDAIGRGNVRSGVNLSLIGSNSSWAVAPTAPWSPARSCGEDR